MTSEYRLVMRSGPTLGKTFTMEKSEYFIGRDLNNEIVIDDPEISRRHARLFLQGKNYVIEDLGSTNGTSVNDQRLMGPYVLRPGELIMLGENISLIFESTKAESHATVVSAGARQASTRQAQPPGKPAAYAGQVPATPMPIPPAEKKKFPKWIVVGGGILLLVCICAGGLFAVDVTESWCYIFGPIFNILTPGLCP